MNVRIERDGAGYNFDFDGGPLLWSASKPLKTDAAFIKAAASEARRAGLPVTDGSIVRNTGAVVVVALR